MHCFGVVATDGGNFATLEIRVSPALPRPHSWVEFVQKRGRSLSRSCGTMVQEGGQEMGNCCWMAVPESACDSDVRELKTQKEI